MKSNNFAFHFIFAFLTKNILDEDNLAYLKSKHLQTIRNESI